MPQHLRFSRWSYETVCFLLNSLSSVLLSILRQVTESAGNFKHISSIQDIIPCIQKLSNTQVVTLTYENKGGRDVSFSLTNLFGQQVYARSHRGMGAGLFNFVINTSDLAPGIYFLNMESAGEKITKKLVISR